jgi:hypothetical protein
MFERSAESVNGEIAFTHAATFIRSAVLLKDARVSAWENDGVIIELFRQVRISIVGRSGTRCSMLIFMRSAARPMFSSQVDFLPPNFKSLSRSCCCQDQNSNASLPIALHLSFAVCDKFRQFGIGKRFVVFLDRALLWKCGPDPITGIR